MKTLRDAFDVKIKQKKQDIINDYDIFPDKKLLDKLRTEIIENLIDNEMPSNIGLDEWINDLENGLDTLVGEKGIKLSAGQKQRLNIIRVILLDKEIYILDEPTSNLDSLSENKIYDMINKYLKDKTCLIVTHRPKLTEICNKHYYFDKRVMLEK